MSLFVPNRIDTPELLDEHDAPRVDVERSLRDLRRINRYMGGIAVYRKLVKRLAGENGATILDLGTGSSDLLESVDGDRLKVGIDFKIDHLLYGRELRARRNGHRPQRIALVVADATRLPFRNSAVDIVTSAHFAHHFSPDENAAILAEALRIARCGVAVNDTNRHRLPLLWVRLLSALRLVGRITRADAPASVLRGYTQEEANAIASRSGASRVEVHAMWPFRTGIVLWK